MAAVRSKPAGAPPAVQEGLTRRAALRLISLASVAAAAPGSSSYAAEPAKAFRDIPKAMWVWGLEVDQFDTMKAFAAERGVETIFLSLTSSTRRGLLEDDETLLSRIKRLRDGATKLVALTGDPAWVERPARMPRSLGELLQIEARHHLFDGLHLDVEPHALPAWDEKDRRGRILEGLLEFFDLVRASARDLPLDAALPPQYASVSLGNGENALQSLARRLTIVSLMAYRDQPEAAVEWAAPAIRVLEREGVPWRVGVLVHASKERGTSYVGVGLRRFVADMVRFDRLLRDEFGGEGYRGLAFEDYEGLYDMLGA